MPLRDAEDHHVVFYGSAVKVVEGDVLRNWQRSCVRKLRGFVENNVAKVGWQGGRLLGVLV